MMQFFLRVLRLASAKLEIATPCPTRLARWALDSSISMMLFLGNEQQGRVHLFPFKVPAE